MHEQSRSVINIHAIKKQNLPYIFIWVVYYAWVIAFTTWWTTQPKSNGSAYGYDFRIVVHIINLISSAICVCIFKKERYAFTARIGAPSVIISLAVYFLAPTQQIATIFGVIFAISLGCVNISILIPFTFILNNTEKLLSVVASHILCNGITLFINRLSISRGTEAILSAVILVIALSAVLFFPRSSNLDKTSSAAGEKLITSRDTRKAAIVTLLASTAGAILFLGAGKAAFDISIISSGYDTAAWYYLGGIAGCIIYVLIFMFVKKNIHMTFTVPFSCLALAFLLLSFSDSSHSMDIGLALLLGAGTATGMSTVYYLMGIIGKKHNSMLYIRLCIIVIGICGGISGVLLGNAIVNMQHAVVVVSVTSMIGILLILMFSPSITRICFDESWAGDLTLEEITALKHAIEKSITSLPESAQLDSKLSGDASINDFDGSYAEEISCIAAHKALPNEFTENESTIQTNITAQQDNDTSIQALTKDELKVAMLLINGNTRSDILRKLHMSASEVKNHENSIRKKMLSGSDSEPEIAIIVEQFKLTRRETEMLRCLRRGMTNVAIAEEVFLSEETVRIHVRNLMKKLPIDNRADIADWIKSFDR